MEKKRFNINLDDAAFTKERTPVKSLFQASSSKAGQSVSSTSSSSEQAAGQSAGQPLSYAEFVVQSKKPAPGPQAPPAPQSDSASEVSTGLGAAVTSVKPSTAVGGSDATVSSGPEEIGGVGHHGPSGDQKGEEAEQNQGEGQRSEPGLNLGPKPVGSGSCIVVSPRQRGNPILKFVRGVPWEFGEVVPDYVLGQTTCALFLSYEQIFEKKLLGHAKIGPRSFLRYHNLNPNYIHDRLKLLGNTYTLRVLLTQVDVKNPHHCLKELARICILADCTLILAWSPEEAGRYLETYKSYENKPADLLKEQVEKNYLSKVTDCLTTVKSVNKTDAITLLSTFSSVEGIINASKEELVLCPGLGPQKARRLHDVLHQPFLKSKKKDS